MSVYIEKQKTYQPKTKEVQAIHSQGIQVFENIADWFKQFTTMVETDNLTQEQQNNLLKKRTEIVKSAKEYQEAVKKRAAEKKVDVKLKF